MLNKHISILFLAVGLGCGGQQAEPETFTRTTVHLNEDGTSTVTQVEVTAEALEAAIARRLGTAGDVSSTSIQQAIIEEDAGCPDAAMWIFSGQNLTGNVLCLVGSGSAWLEDYLMYPRVCHARRCNDGPKYWNQKVNSYWAGDWSGYFIKNDGRLNSFAVRQRVDVVPVPTFISLTHF